ncbi:MAG TPA: transporter substrate-binding domain-containing protein, partial [Armatimonadota bacterium]
MVQFQLWRQVAQRSSAIIGKTFKGAACVLMLACIVLSAAALGQSTAGKTGKANLVFSNDVYFPPYVFLEDGKPTGFAVDLVRNLAKVTGQNVDVRLEQWVDVLPDLRTGKVDITSANISKERLEEFDFSVPIADVHYILFVRKGSKMRTMSDAQGKVLIVHRGDITHEFLMKSHIASRIVAVASNDDGLRLLSSGRCDAAFAPKLQGLYFMRKYGLNNIEPTEAGLPPMEYAFAVRKGDRELLRSINEGLGVLKANGTYRELYNKWFGVYEEVGLYDRFRYYIYTFSVVLILLVVSFIWSWSLRRQVRLRTMALTQEIQHRTM